MAGSELETNNSSIDNAHSGKNQLAILETENGQKYMVIYERELRVYAKTNSIREVYAIMTGTDEKPKWELEFHLKGEDERALLVTSKHKPRQFPKLNYMVLLLKDWCPNLDEIKLGVSVQREEFI